MNFPGGWELIVVVLLIMVLFGYKKLPEATRSLGKSVRIFKAEMHEDEPPAASAKVQDTTSPTVPTTTTTTASVEGAPAPAAVPVAPRIADEQPRQAEPHQQP